MAAGPLPPDAAGGKDHPLLTRFQGSALIAYKVSDWDQTSMPLVTPDYKDALKEKDRLSLEGRITRLEYLSPQGKTPLEVFRNYEQALTAAGFKKRYACESGCNDLYFAWSRAVYDKIEGSMTWAKGGIALPGSSPYSLQGALTFENARVWVGSLSKSGQDVHVLVYTSVAHRAETGSAVTYIEIVEPKAMPTGQVTVDAGAMTSGLQADGRIALYGLYFDTGKAAIKPESRPQLDEMAKLLKATPALKVYIVGHTDNVGALDTNLALSTQRAQSVVDALAKDHGIDAKRLSPRGVASLSPLASNAAEAGRAKNRRVELVLQ
jgi:OmpA-OmpF porin, OOP family